MNTIKNKKNTIRQQFTMYEDNTPSVAEAVCVATIILSDSFIILNNTTQTIGIYT